MEIHFIRVPIPVIFSKDAVAIGIPTAKASGLIVDICIVEIADEDFIVVIPDMYMGFSYRKFARRTNEEDVRSGPTLNSVFNEIFYLFLVVSPGCWKIGSPIDFIQTDEFRAD